MSNTFVCIMGMGTVFIGLICIVVICSIMSAVMKMFSKNTKVSAPTNAAPAVASNMPIQNKQAIIAGTCAVIAEELGTDVSNIRVLSFKKI